MSSSVWISLLISSYVHAVYVVYGDCAIYTNSLAPIAMADRAGYLCASARSFRAQAMQPGLFPLATPLLTQLQWTMVPIKEVKV